MNKAQEVFYLSLDNACSGNNKDDSKSDFTLGESSAVPGVTSTTEATSFSDAHTRESGKSQYSSGRQKTHIPSTGSTSSHQLAVTNSTPVSQGGKGAVRQQARTNSNIKPLGNCTKNVNRHLNNLAALIANITEAYTVGIYLANNDERFLYLAGVHTLSRDFIHSAKIGFGCGLIGWTADNAVRISVCPFEHDARTLLCYEKNQDLKSFIAVPIINDRNVLLGVISCDSKKNYAFAKVTEKILLDCAAQAAVLITLLQQTSVKSPALEKPQQDLLSSILEKMQNANDEESLLNTAANLPQELVKRDALVIITTGERQSGAASPGKFYSTSTESRLGHRLLEMVCKHKKIICADRSVHALPVDDIKQRSFLSIPFHVLGREAGSFNLLSSPHEAFTAAQISTLEKTAKVVGRELERVRLRERLASSDYSGGLLSYKNFCLNTQPLLAEAAAQSHGLSLLRLTFNNIADLEYVLGVEGAVSCLAQISRLVEQTVRAPAIACSLYGSQMLILADSAEAERIVLRLRRLIERLGAGDMRTKDSLREVRQPSTKLGMLLNRCLEIQAARFPTEGGSLNELLARTRASNNSAAGKQAIGELANAGNW